MAYIGNDVDAIFIPSSVNTSTDLRINGGALTQTGGDVNLDGGTFFLDESANRVGIGTITPGVTLDVVGTIRATNINALDLSVEDKNIVIGDVASPTNTTADGGGITLKGAVDKTIAWLNATAAWTFSEHVSIASAKEYRIAGTKVLDATSLGSAVVSSSLTSVGTIASGTWQGTAIADTYLGTISTALKVSNSATTATSANTASAIVARDESNSFTAGTITAALTGAASSNVLKAGDTMTGALVVPLASAATPSLTFTDDLNTGIYSPGADQVAVATNGVGRVFVDASGNVGIGTTSPSSVYRTTINGDGSSIVGGLSLRNNGTETLTIGNVTAANNVDSEIWNPRNGYLRFATNNTERARINASGNVGIGTTNPSEKLEVNGRTVLTTETAPFYGLKVRDYSNTTGVYVGSVSGGSAWYIGDSYYYNSNLWRTDKTHASSINFVSGSLEFYTNTGLTAGVDYTPSRKMILDSSGRLLMGTSSSQIGAGENDLLQVSGAIQVVSSTSVYSRLLPTASGLEIIANAYPANLGSTQSIILKSGTSGGGGPSEIARFNSDGNIKLTSNTYQALAHKNYGYSSVYGAVVIGATGNNYTNVSLGVDVSTIAGGNFTGQSQVIFPSNGALVPNNAGTNFIGVFSRNSSDSILIGPASSAGISDGPLTVTTSNVGIGTTNPTAKLDVDGTVKANILSTSSYAAVGSIVAADPGSSYYGWNNRIGSGLAVVGTTYLDGNVGIGTTNPATKLHVRQSADFDGITLTHATRAGIWKIYHSGTSSENIAFVQNNGTSDAVSYVAGRDTHNWYTGGTSKMIITSAGSVGVGTDDPVGKLSVSGPSNSRLLNVAEGSTSRFLINGSTASGDAGNAVFYTGAAFDASHYMVLQNNTDAYGRVGLVIRGKTFIGANNPSDNDGWNIAGPRSGIRFEAYLSGDTGFDSKFSIQHLLTGGTNNSIGDLGILAKGYSTAAPAVIITAAGNVGIGSANPAIKFVVVGSNTVAKIESTTSYVDIQLANSQSTTGYIQYLEGNLRFFASSGSTPTLTITGGSPGRVGIGITDPQSSLDLKVAPATSTIATLGYSANASLNIRIPNVTNNVGQIVFTNNDGPTAGYASIGVVMTSGAATGLGDIIMATKSVGTNAASEERLRITSGGNVGIGTTNPDTRLDVRGSIAAGGRGLNVPHVIVKDTNGNIKYFEYYFSVYKPAQIGTTSVVNIVTISSLSSFHQAAYTIEYGTRLQQISDSTTSVCLKQFGVNRFNSGNVAITDTNDIVSDTNSNTHANITCVTNGSSGYIIRVEFSADIASSSFASGVIRGWGVADAIENITFAQGG